MKLFYLVIYLTLSAQGMAASQFPQTATGIALDSVWKVKAYQFATDHATHVAWGRGHSERNYQLAMKLAQSEKWTVDSDVLFAAAFFHDLGAIAPFQQAGVEHELRSVEVMEPLLKSYGFPNSKLPLVKEVILEHMYYHSTPPHSQESKVFHDADALDFLGEIGVVRIVALSSKGHAWAPDLPGAISTLQGWAIELPQRLVTESAKRMAVSRASEMQSTLELLSQETYFGKAL